MCGLGDNGAMDTLELSGRRFTLHRAVAGDLPELVALLADDVLGRERESDDLAPYEQALALIDRDPNQLLLAVRDEEGAMAATMQLTLMPSLSRGGAMRLQLEAVRVAGSARCGGLGTALFSSAHGWGRAQGATMGQVATGAARTQS